MVCCESGGGEGTAWTLGPRGPVEPGVTQPYLNMPPDLPAASRLLQRMDLRTMTQSLVTLAEDNMAFFSSQGPGETARRLTGVFAGIREQALGLDCEGLNPPHHFLAVRSTLSTGSCSIGEVVSFTVS